MAYTNDKKFNFEYPELTTLHIELDYLTILNMTKDLKTNAQSQHSDIGGGHYGYLPLVIPEAEFLSLPNTLAVVFPIALAPFNTTAGTTAVQPMVLRYLLETETKAYLEYVQMQFALKN